MKKIIFFIPFLILFFISSDSQILNKSNTFSIQTKNLFDYSPESIYKTNSRVPFGYLATTTVVGLCLASDITRDYTMPSLPLGIAATTIILVSVPYLSKGAKHVNYYNISDRINMQIRTRASLAWGFYVGSSALALSLVFIGALEITPPPGLILFTGIMGATSILFMTSGLNLALKSNKSNRQHTFYKPHLNLGASYNNYAGLANVRLTF